MKTPKPYPFETAEILVPFERIRFQNPDVEIAGEVELAVELNSSNKYRKIIAIGEIRVTQLNSGGSKVPIIKALRGSIVDDLRNGKMIGHPEIIRITQDLTNNEPKRLVPITGIQHCASGKIN